MGFAIGWFMSKASQKQNSDEGQLATYKTQSEERARQLEELKTKFQKEENENDNLRQSLARLETINLNLEDRLKKDREELEKLQEKFASEFKVLAQTILDEKSQKFTELNKSNIGEILNPLKERIEKFEQKVDKSSKENLEWNSTLREQIKGLRDLNVQMTKEAESLTKALRGDSKTQGNWGEMQLEAILEKVGLEKDVHYFKERNYKNEDGSNQRPDYIVNLPDDKNLILDSKVSLTAYSHYFDTDDEIEKEKYLKKHLESIYSHIKLLSEKNYQKLHDINQPDYVLMFIANEPALTIALKNDHSLYEKAWEKNVVLVSTTTLMATLSTISYIWKQDLQNKNALEIAKKAGDMYDKFVGLVEDLKNVGNRMNSAKDSYDAAMNKLVDGKGNLVKRAEDLKALGAKAGKQLDQRIIDRVKEE